MSKHDSAPAHDFRESVAKRFAEWAQVGALSNAGLTSDLGYVGMSAEVKASDTPAVQLEIKHDPTEGLPAGTTRDQFTAEALAKYDAAVLETTRQRVWTLIRSRCESGTISTDEATATLIHLGFTPDQCPKLESDVTVYTYDTEGDDVYHAFKLAGKASEDAIRERFQAAQPVHPNDAAIREVMGDDAILPTRQPSVSVRTRTSWTYAS